MFSFGSQDGVKGGWSSIIGIVTAICGNVLISFALNTQRYAHIRLSRQREQGAEQKKKSRRGADYGTTSQQEDIAEQREEQNLHPDGHGSHAGASETDALIPSSSSTSSESTVKPAKNDSSSSSSSSSSQTSYLRSPYWWLGIALMTVGEAGNFLAYGFAPASIVSPLGVVALVSNCLIAPLMLHERFRKRDGFGVIVAVAGCVVVVLSASDNNPRLGPDEIWKLISTWEFETYFGITVFLMAVLMTASTKYGHKSVLIDLGLVGLFGGYTALSTKGVASLLSNTIWRAVTFPITYLLVAILVSTAILQIKYVNRALQNFNSTEVIPIQFVLFTLSVIVGSAILYRDFERTTTDDALKFFAGCALTFSGVWLITSGRSKSREDDEEEGYSDDEEAIDLIDEEHQQHDVRARPGGESRRGSLKPDTLRRLKSSHSDAPSFVFTSDDGPGHQFSFEDGSPLGNNPWTLPAPANISSIHPRSTDNLPQDKSLKHAPPMHATTSAPTVPTAASLRANSTLKRPSTPNRSPSMPQDSPSGPPLSPSQQRRHLDPSDATPGRLHTLAQILPGPLTSPLSSSLSAIVADNLRRGVETSPGSLRRQRSRAEGVGNARLEGSAPLNRQRTLSSTFGDFLRRRSRSGTLEERPAEEEAEERA